MNQMYALRYKGFSLGTVISLIHLKILSALKRFRAQSYNLVILGIKMPQLNGFLLYRVSASNQMTIMGWGYNKSLGKCGHNFSPFWDILFFCFPPECVRYNIFSQRQMPAYDTWVWSANSQTILGSLLLSVIMIRSWTVH